MISKHFARVHAATSRNNEGYLGDFEPRSTRAILEKAFKIVHLTNKKLEKTSERINTNDFNNVSQSMDIDKVILQLQRQGVNFDFQLAQLEAADWNELNVTLGFRTAIKALCKESPGSGGNGRELWTYLEEEKEDNVSSEEKVNDILPGVGKTLLLKETENWSKEEKLFNEKGVLDPKFGRHNTQLYEHMMLSEAERTGSGRYIGLLALDANVAIDYIIMIFELLALISGLLMTIPLSASRAFSNDFASIINFMNGGNTLLPILNMNWTQWDYNFKLSQSFVDMTPLLQHSNSSLVDGYNRKVLLQDTSFFSIILMDVMDGLCFFNFVGFWFIAFYSVLDGLTTAAGGRSHPKPRIFIQAMVQRLNFYEIHLSRNFWLMWILMIIKVELQCFNIGIFLIGIMLAIFMTLVPFETNTDNTMMQLNPLYAFHQGTMSKTREQADAVVDHAKYIFGKIVGNRLVQDGRRKEAKKKERRYSLAAEN
eukprot:g271.t1